MHKPRLKGPSGRREEMSDTLIGLLPLYGAYIIALIVGLSAMAITLPASVLVATAGGFAAAGDLALWQVGLGAFIGFSIGDQCAFFLARSKGPWIMGKLKSSSSRAKLIDRAEGFLTRNGIVAVLLSRTVLSPLGPYVTYISGAIGLGWVKFTSAAMVGAALWSGAYSYLGYVFAGNISQISSALGNALGFIAAAGVLVGSGYWLFRRPSADSKAAETPPEESG